MQCTPSASTCSRGKGKKVSKWRGPKKGSGIEGTTPYAVALWIDRKFRFRVVELEVALADLAAILDGDDALLEPVLFDRSCDKSLSSVSPHRPQITR